jgi:hypothetical protein
MSPRCPVCDGWGFLPLEGEGGEIVDPSPCECGSDPELRNREEMAELMTAAVIDGITAERIRRAEVVYLREPESPRMEVLHDWPR